MWKIGRRNWFTALPQLSVAQGACLLWENVQCWRRKLSEIHVWKRFSKPFNSHTRPFNHDVCLSQENCLWFYSYDKWRKSSNDFRPNSVKIPNWLLSKHYLWQRLQSQGKGSKNKMEISNGIFHEGGWSCMPLTFFSIFQKISRIVTIKNWMEISDIKSGVGGRWGWGVRCLMANAI